MKKAKFLLWVFLGVIVLAALVILATGKTPPGNLLSEQSNPACVARSLAGVPLVNGLGQDVKIPLFPGATRVSWPETGSSQYSVKAYDGEILGFYEDRLRDLCWQIKEQKPNQIVYKNDGQELRLSLLPNPPGRTVIDYVVTTSPNVLGQVRIADHVAACTTDQYYCNGGCVANGTSCPAPTDASSCTGGTIWCTSSSGTGGWCQMPPCPSSTSTTPSSSTCGSGQWWCSGACISMTSPCNGYYPNGTTSSSGSSSGSTTTCTGTYQQSGSAYPTCNYSTCPNGCTWDGNGCPSGCYTSSAATNTNTWPTDQASCTSQGKFWCTSQSSSGWCQSSSCPAGDYSYNTWPTDQATCTSRSYVWCPGSNGASSWCAPSLPCASSGTSTTGSCSSGYYWCPSTNSCVTSSQGCGSNTTTSPTCPSGQYMCNGACISSGSSCTQTAWPTDQASCTSQAKFWCTGSYSGSGSSGWCQSTACSTNYSATTCASGQWSCNNVCIPTSSSCNGYYYNSTTSTTCPSGQYMCNGACVSSNTSCASPASTWPTSQAGCAERGYFWCPATSSRAGWCSASSCPANITSCPAGQWICEGSCISTAMACGDRPYNSQAQAQLNQPQPNDQARLPQNTNEQRAPDQSNRPNQFNGPSEEDQTRMRAEQFKQMKRGVDQFTRGVNQMKTFVNRLKTRLTRAGVGIPAELTNALAKAPELIAKLKAAKTQEEFEDLMGDMQDIGMIMQDWGPRLGELERLGSMLKNLDKDVRSMNTVFRRAKTAVARRPEAADSLKEAEVMLGVLTKKAAEAKALAKTDSESALDLVQDFYGESEEFWNQVAFVEMIGNVQRGLTQANTEIRRAETRIRTIERGKQADAETIAILKEMLVGIKETLPELKAVIARRPIDYEEIRAVAEGFWQQIEEFENLLAEQGQSFYAPTVKSGAGINVVIPDGFLGSSAGQAEVTAPTGF